MADDASYPRFERQFSDLRSEVESVIDTARRLPHLAFRTTTGLVDICEYEEILTDEFAEVLRSLCDVHGDESVVFVTLEPDPLEYYVKHYEHVPGFRIRPDELRDGYWSHLTYLPGGDALGAILYTANVVGLMGSSGTWSVWGERNWEMGLIHSQAERRTWLDSDVRFFPTREALSLLREGPGSRPLTDSERSIFLTSIDDMAERQSE